MFALFYVREAVDFVADEIRTLGRKIKRKKKVEDGNDSSDSLENAFKKLSTSSSDSLLKKYLTDEVFEKLKDRKTSNGCTLLDCIQSGVENLDSGIGVYAADAEAYRVFAELFNPIISEYHVGYDPAKMHPALNWGNMSKFDEILDPKNEMILSTRIRVGRSLSKYPFNPCLTLEQYKEIEKQVITSLRQMASVQGEYWSLEKLDKETKKDMIENHFLFKEGDRFLQAAKACRYWPQGRGIFMSKDKDLIIWVNEEDHLRIISMEKGGNVKSVFERLRDAVTALEKRLKFATSAHHGFLTFCPTNLGTSIRASVLIRIPLLVAEKKILEKISKHYHLQVRGTRGEHSEAEGGVVDVSNRRRLGLTEFDAVYDMYTGVEAILNEERSLRRQNQG